MIEKETVLDGQDAFDKLAELSKQQDDAPQAVSNGATVQQEIDAAFSYTPRPIELVSGWAFIEWKQQHVMSLYETDALTADWPNRFRRNYEVVKAAIDCGCFDKPTAVRAGILDNMTVEDVEQLHDAIVANFMNTVNTPKKK